MGDAAFDGDLIGRLDRTMRSYAESGAVPGSAWAVARHGQVHRGSAGTFEVDGGPAVGDDAIFRIASMTKPVTAVGALVLVEECVLRLDDPVDDLLPELADREVLVGPRAALDDTVPATRSITLRDLLTFRFGLGMDFTSMAPTPLLDAMAAAGVGLGPPLPQHVAPPDEWMRQLGSLPLMYQPGTRWLYHTGSDVLGVLVARASGRQLEDFLRDRILEPLEMSDTAFSVPGRALDRFGPCYLGDPDDTVFDPADGHWSTPPVFCSGGGGLVATVGDYLSFAQMLLDGGTLRGRRILSRASVEAMTTNQLLDGQGGPEAGVVGWGFGLSVQTRRTSPVCSVGSYGWNGGLGSVWVNDPTEGLVAVLATNRMWTSPVPPPVITDFLTCVYAAMT